VRVPTPFLSEAKTCVAPLGSTDEEELSIGGPRPEERAAPSVLTADPDLLDAELVPRLVWVDSAKAWCLDSIESRPKKLEAPESEP
jgi:hypothetical protein